MKTHSLISRHRLLIKFFILAISLGVLTVSPAAADVMVENAGWSCESQCWAWEQGKGCTREAVCCANTDGRWFCVE